MRLDLPGRLTATFNRINNRLLPPDRAPGATRPHSHRLHEDDVVGRLKDLSTSYYAGIFNVAKGVALAAIGVSAAELYEKGLPPSRCVLLATAFLAIVITYNGASVGRTIVHVHPALVDTVVPMGIAVNEIIVVRLPAVVEAGQVPLLWLIALAVWHAMAGVMIFSILYRIRSPYYEARLWPLVARYRERMLTDLWAATGGGLLILIYIASSELAYPGWDGWDHLDLGFAVVIGLLLCKGMSHQEETRKEMIKGLRALAASE